MAIRVDVFRTKVIGAGNSYDVLVPVRYKLYRPLAAGCYATVINRDGESYYRVDDFLRTAWLDGLQPLSDERLNEFRRMRRVADRLAIRIAKRAFRELKGRDRMPTLWTETTLPSDRKTIEVDLNCFNEMMLCQ